MTRARARTHTSIMRIHVHVQKREEAFLDAQTSADEWAAAVFYN